MPVSSPRCPRYLIGLFAVILAALTYNSWIWGEAINPDLAQWYPVLSELGAKGQPGARFFRAADLITVALLLAPSCLLAWSVRKDLAGRKLFRLGAALWALFLLSTVFDALFPLSCVNSGEFSVSDVSECRDLSTHIHEISSTLAGIASIGVVLLVSYYLLFRACRARFALQLLLFAFGVVHVLTTVIVATILGLHLDYVEFGLQRVSTLSLSVWWVCGFAIWRSSLRAWGLGDEPSPLNPRPPHEVGQDPSC